MKANRWVYLLGVIFGWPFVWTLAIAASEPKITFHVVVPEQYLTATYAPNGDPERVRYTKAYEAFWWNCVMVVARDLTVRCPEICSGTPGATAGCRDGANNARRQIDAQITRSSASELRSYLSRLAASPDALKKLHGYGYFVNGPEGE